MSSEAARSRLILALDVGSDVEDALSWVGRLKGHVGMFKVGKEAFTSFGPEIVKGVQERGGKVFLDLKFHDIPNTVAGAAEAATKLGVAMFNLHALGGRKMMEEAVRAAKAVSERMGSPMPVVLAVTVLTSLNEGDMEELGFHKASPQQLVVRLARLAKEAGVSGVVASAQEAKIIRDACGRDFVIVTPGIRTSGTTQRDDQKRVVTPEEAVRRGADYVVVGRPILEAPDPVGAADGIVEAIAAGLAGRGKK